MESRIGQLPPEYNPSIPPDAWLTDGAASFHRPGLLSGPMAVPGCMASFAASLCTRTHLACYELSLQSVSFIHDLFGTRFSTEPERILEHRMVRCGCRHESHEATLNADGRKPGFRKAVPSRYGTSGSFAGHHAPRFLYLRWKICGRRQSAPDALHAERNRR